MIIAAACSSRVWLYSHALLTCRSSRRRRSHLAQVVVSHNARPTPRERHARQHVVKPIPRFDSIDAFEKQLQPSQGLAWWGLPFILTASGGSSGGGPGCRECQTGNRSITLFLGTQVPSAKLLSGTQCPVLTSATPWRGTQCTVPPSASLAAGTPVPQCSSASQPRPSRSRK